MRRSLALVTNRVVIASRPRHIVSNFAAGNADYHAPGPRMHAAWRLRRNHGVITPHGNSPRLPLVGASVPPRGTRGNLARDAHPALVQCLRRWLNIEPTLGEHHLLAFHKQWIITNYSGFVGRTARWQIQLDSDKIGPPKIAADLFRTNLAVGIEFACRDANWAVPFHTNQQSV